MKLLSLALIALMNVSATPAEERPVIDIHALSPDYELSRLVDDFKKSPEFKGQKIKVCRNDECVVIDRTKE